MLSVRLILVSAIKRWKSVFLATLSDIDVDSVINLIEAYTLSIASDIVTAGSDIARK